MHFPMFVDLTGKKVVVIGGGAVALRRAAVLRDFGAMVTIIAPDIKGSIEGVAFAMRNYKRGDLQGAFLAVAATSDRMVNWLVGEEARRIGIPVNIADAPKECDFYFPAICRGEGLVAGLVGDGSDHHRVSSAAKVIRQVLEEME